MEPKPFKSIDEQIHILQDRGMIIDDASRARNALETIGYYKLSGYSYPFRRKREGTNEIADEFTEGTTFEEVLAVYSYDETLREATAHELSRTRENRSTPPPYAPRTRPQSLRQGPRKAHGRISSVD